MKKSKPNGGGGEEDRRVTSPSVDMLMAWAIKNHIETRKGASQEDNRKDMRMVASTLKGATRAIGGGLPYPGSAGWEAGRILGDVSDWLYAMPELDQLSAWLEWQRARMLEEQAESDKAAYRRDTGNGRAVAVTEARHG